MSHFYDHLLGICCTSLYFHPRIVKRLGNAAQLVPPPLLPKGFVQESSLIGVVAKQSECIEEATLLLGFITSERGRRC